MLFKGFSMVIRNSDIPPLSTASQIAFSKGSQQWQPLICKYLLLLIHPLQLVFKNDTAFGEIVVRIYYFILQGVRGV